MKTFFYNDEIVLPVESTPLWVLGAIVVAVFGGIVFLAYFFINSH